ncbi:hypothetical protein [uncultured Arcobacter sp.]|uniref:hypothetical protein n=1 Tax=uncultured Arcobacter sp. TaxID=165434 RepID=UPI00262A1BF3|nr:hypothetical protein [uncultured Arcobacter sp.]
MYLRLLSLDQYIETNNGKYFAHFRCPVCGDSHKSKYKKRGWAFNNNTLISIGCFNCGYNDTFYNFLRDHYPEMFDSYKMECFKQKLDKSDKKVVFEEQKPKETNIHNDLVKVSDLPPFHKAVKYLKFRLIPEKYYDYMYYTSDFEKFVKSQFKESDDGIINDPSPERIVMPLYTQNKSIYGYCGARVDRSSDNKKYINIKLKEHKKVYGLERLDRTKPIYVTEGIFDSLMVENGLAVLGGMANLDFLSEYSELENFILLFDNEKHNPDTMKFMERALKKGFKVCLYPKTFKYKDLNKAHTEGLTLEDISNMIHTNTVQGQKGLLKFKLWRNH